MASYFPMVKNTAQRIVFPILDADGDPVTGAAADTPDSEYSLDGGSFADITDEIHELATASGVYYLDLATGETNGDVVCIQIKTATAGTKTTVLVFYTAAQSLDTMDTNIDDIETDTNELQTDWTDGGRLDLLIDAIPTTAMRGTDSAALASAWTAALATVLGNYTATRAGYLDNLAANVIADEILKRDIDQVEATTALHSLATAILKAVSRIKDDAGTLKTYRTDGTTLHMSQTITTDADNEPIDELTAGT